MKTILAGILLVVVVANAEKPCEIPRKFAGNFATFGYNIDADKADETSGKLFYDANNKRMRIDGEHEGKQYSVIMDYQEGKQYVFGEGYCFATAVKGHFQDMSLPDNANVVNGGRIGTASNGLNVNRYFGEKDGGKGIATVTQKDCVMTSGVSISKRDGGNYLSYFSMTDVDLSYEDNVFDKPEGCRDVPDGRARRSVGGFWENLQAVIDI